MKKLLALVLALLMVLGCMSITAFADGDSWSYDASEKTFTVNCTIPEQATAGGTIPEAVFFSAKQENKDIVFGAGWGKAVDPQTPVAFEYNSKHWCDPRNIEETSFASGSEYGYLILIAYDPNKFGDLSDAKVLVNGKEYDVGVVYPYDKPISSTMLESGAKIAGVFLAIDFGTLSSDGDFSGGDFEEAESGNKSGTTTITATKAEPELEYTIVIPTATTLNDEAHTNVLLGGDSGKASIEVTTHNSKTNVYYTVNLTNATLTDGTNTITTTYAYAQGEGEYTALTGETKVTVYEGGTVKDSTVQVTADETSWTAAPAGTYTASVVFNFGTEDAGETVVTIGDVLATVDGGFPEEFNAAWGYDDESYYCCFCFKDSDVDKLGFYDDPESDPLVSFELSETLTTVDGGYKFEDETNTLTFNMTSNKLTSIVANFNNGNGSGTYVELGPA